MAIDHGLVRIGIALSDPIRLIARPFQILTHISQDADLKRLKDIITSQDVVKVVVGIPTNSQGGVSRQAEKVIKWAQRFATDTSVTVIGWDESYSSVDAAEIARNNGRQSRKKGYLDDLAAAILLQDYLNAGGGSGEPGQSIETYAKTK